jgi:ParB-like nuclease domain
LATLYHRLCLPKSQTNYTVYGCHMAEPALVGAELKFVEPSKLEFDPDNPRFGGRTGSKSQAEIQKVLFGAPYYASELVDSLIENGFISYEPLVVRKHGSKFVVIEGNRRLAAVNEIRANLDKYPSRKSDLGKIPVLVFPDNETEQKRVYLGVRHLLGVREWPPLAKAVFLDKESKGSGGLDKVLKEVRLTKTQARRFLIPYRLLKQANVPLPPGEDFWVLAEALGRSGVKEFVELDVDAKTLNVSAYDKKNLSILLDDLYGPKLSGSENRDSKKRKVQDTRDLSLYASILGSDKARTALRSGRDLDDAAIYVGTNEQSLAKLMKMIKALKLLVSKLAPSARRKIEADKLREAVKALESAAKAFGKTDA